MPTIINEDFYEIRFLTCPDGSRSLSFCRCPGEGQFLPFGETMPPLENNDRQVMLGAPYTLLPDDVAVSPKPTESARRKNEALWGFTSIVLVLVFVVTLGLLLRKR